MKSRNWIKGHFYQGLFFGLITGVTIGVFFILYPIVSLIFAIVIYLVKDYIEEWGFKKYA